MRGGMKMMAAARARNDNGNERQNGRDNPREAYRRNAQGAYGNRQRRNGFYAEEFEMDDDYEMGGGRYGMAGEEHEMLRRRGYGDQRRDLWQPDMRTPYLSMAGGYEMQGGYMERMDKTMAKRWADQMENADGSRGAHWTAEQIRPYMQQVGFAGSPDEFYVVMNSMFSDFYKVAKKYNLDRPEFYADLAKAWLEDPDAMEDKAALYYRYIVKK